MPAVWRGLVADAGIEFALASRDPDGRPSDGITRTRTTRTSFGTGDSVKSSKTGGADPWPSDRFLNLWVCTLGDGLLGYAQFPGGPRRTDGVVITASAFGTSGTARAPFDRGRTAVHEIGHWLNLRHIWGDTEDCSGSDLVADTPNAAGPNYGKPRLPARLLRERPERRHVHELHGLRGRRGDAALHAPAGRADACGAAGAAALRRAQPAGGPSLTSRAAHPELCRRWVHSHEEDAGDALVFRPSGHPLPPSRGRRSLDLRRDGTLFETRPGADDRAEGSRGRWALKQNRLLLFHDAEARRPDRELEVVALASDRLVLKPPTEPAPTRPKRARR